MKIRRTRKELIAFRKVVKYYTDQGMPTDLAEDRAWDSFWNERNLRFKVNVNV